MRVAFTGDMPEKLSEYVRVLSEVPEYDDLSDMPEYFNTHIYIYLYVYICIVYIYTFIYMYIIHVYTRSEIVRRFRTLFNRFIRCQQDITVCLAKYVLSACVFVAG